MQLLWTENGGGWGLVASPVFKTGVTRLSRAWWVRFPHSPARLVIVFAILVAQLVVPNQAGAQRSDSTRAGVSLPVPASPPDSSAKIGISPRRAFLTTLAVPGYMQLRFHRRKAAAIFLAVEAGTLGMTIKSRHDLDVAKAARSDTVVSLVVDGGGLPVIDPITGKQKQVSTPRNKNIADRVKARRIHLEDWIAGIVFNHLFAGADAFVAANLADFNTNVSVASTGRGVQVLASFAW